MSEENSEQKPRNKKDPKLVENGIYQVGPNLYDVKVRKRIKSSDKGAGVQKTKAKRSVRFLTEARKIRNQFVHELELEEKGIRNGDYNWKQAKELYFEFRKNHVEAKTFSNQQYIVNKYTETWDVIRLSEFKREFIENDLRQRLPVKTPISTVKGVLKHIRAVFEYHFHKEKSPLTHNPSKGIKAWGEVSQNDELPKMTVEEIKKLLNYLKETNYDLYAICYLTYQTGIRSGEAWELKWSDINTEYDTITISRSYCFETGLPKKPKNKTTRKIPIHSSLRSFLKEHKLKSDSSYVLPHIPDWRDGKIARTLKDVQRTLKITVCSFHSLRASYITHQLMGNVPALVVQNIVGHADYKTTSRYARQVGREKAIRETLDLLKENEDAEVINLKKRSKKISG